jgi:DNA-binding beta-propeller fold protein YncE/cbb3-type cytochrome oxidase subunit 3
MLALIYFALAVLVGDFLCRRFYQFESAAHRCAAAILVGLVVSSWFTYLAGLAFFWTPQPLLWADLLFFVAAVALLSWPKWKGRILKSTSGEAHLERSNLYLTRPEGSSIADWLLIAGYVVLVSWMMFASFNTSGGKLRIANPEYSDFGPNTALIQSFAVGHNFPTEYPHFSGDRIRYHFLFYFQAGNLEFLGLNPAWSLNLLSITTLVSMLVIVMTLGEVLFDSRAVGRLGSLLFFFFGSLSYVPFLQKQASVRAAIEAITHQRDYLQTIFPYRGEAWGTWSQVTYLNQRHFATAIGIFFLVLVFLAIRYRAVAAKRAEARAAANTAIAQPDESPDTESMPVTANPRAPEDVREPQADTRVVAAVTDESPDTGSKPVTEPGESPDTGSMPVTVNPAAPEEVREPQAKIPAVAVIEPTHGTEITREPFLATLPPFIFSGALLGLLPMFNSAVFLAAAAVLGVLFLLFSLRGQMLVLAATSGVIALPQMLYLSTGSGRAQMPKLLHWGYTIDHPTFENVIKYLGFTFGFKWALIALALIFATSVQRRLFVAFLSLLAVAFCFQFTIEVLANQKFIHIWVIVANLFVAFGFWRLWHFSLGGTTVPARFIALALLMLSIPGGVIDFFPIHNTGWSEVTYKDDPFIDWLKKNTTPREIFLTDRFVNHPILMAGRRVFYGWPYYSWGAGYDATKRDKVYINLFESRDPWKVFHLLKENGISYVAFDGAVRQAQFMRRPNEELYATFFPKVFDDKQNKYNSLTIYKVPNKPPPNLSMLPEAVSNMFEGGRGTGKGEFDSPVGIAVDRGGNFFVADTNNARIEKFSSKGTFLDSIGTKGSGQGQFGAPNGIAVDHSDNIYVADAGNHRVQKLTSDGKLIAEWRGPDVGFYGPRRIAVGADDSVYVVDQGRTRVVKFSPDGKVLTAWGTKGTGDGQFDDPASVAVDTTTNKVYVADPRNKRIQVFDSDGKFVTKWIVPEWGGPYGFEDVAIDPKTGRLYASSTHMNTVLIFDLNGNRIGSLRPKPPEVLDGPSALALANGKMYVLNMLGNRVTVIDL